MTNRLHFFAVFLFAALTRLLFLYYFPSHLTDFHLIQTAAENLTTGHGMGFQRSSVNDLSSFYFEGLRLWPPLVTLVTAFLNIITGNSLVADTLYVSFGMMGLLWVMYRLAKTIGINNNWTIALFLFLAVSPEIIKHPGTSDVVSAFFCTWALLATTQWAQFDKKKPFYSLIALSFLLFLPSAFRYQYYPVSLILPITGILYALHTKNKNFIKEGSICLALVVAFILLQEILLYYYTEQTLTTFVEKDEKGIYFTNLKEIYPFFFKIFLNMSYLENSWQGWFHKHRYLYFLISVLLFFGWFYLLFRKSNYQTIKREKRQFAFWLIITVLLFSLLTLAGLSFTHKSKINPPGIWTYVMEGRYFIVPSLLILLLSIWKTQQYYITCNNRKRNVILLVLSTLILYNGVLTIKFYYNIANRKIPSQQPRVISEREVIGNFILQKATESNIPLVISTQDPSIGFYPYHKNIAVTEDTDLLFSKTIRTTKSVNLYLIMVKNKAQNKNEFLIKTKASQIFQFKKYIVYSLYVEPNQPLKLSE